MRVVNDFMMVCCGEEELSAILLDWSYTSSYKCTAVFRP